MKLIIPKKIEEKIHAYVMSVDSEIAGMGKVEIVDGNAVVRDVMIYEQTVSGATADLSSEALAKWLSDLVRAGGSPKDWKLWFHSHHTMRAFFSGTDTATIDRESGADWLISLVVNVKREREARLDIYKPWRVAVEDLDIEIEGEQAFTIPAEIALEVAQKVKKREAVPSTYYKHSAGDEGAGRSIGFRNTITLRDEIELHEYCPMQTTLGKTRECLMPYGEMNDQVYAKCTTKAFKKKYGKLPFKNDIKVEEVAPSARDERDYSTAEIMGFIKAIDEQISYLEGKGDGAGNEALELKSELSDWYYALAELESDENIAENIRNEARIIEDEIYQLEGAYTKESV